MRASYVPVCFTDAIRCGMSTRAPEEMCAVCLEPLAQGADRLRGSPRCSHFFHAACVQAWQDEKKTCPTCRASPPGTLPPSTCLAGDSDAEPRGAPSRTVRIFTWLTLLLTPWPRSPGGGADNRGAGTGGAEEWNAARGIGDWRARMERIYAAEAAAETAGSNDDDDDDDDDEEHDVDAEDDDAEDEDDDEDDEAAASGPPLPPTEAHIGPVVSLS